MNILRHCKPFHPQLPKQLKSLNFSVHKQIS
jgi:hypothetical protein